jgi:Na+/proline symporter
MNLTLILSVIAIYFIILIAISFLTSRKADNNSFFLGNKKSPWFIVAFGMIGASISGVTFISVPGWVGDSNFSYMQVVFGYFIGYLVVAQILMPIYYKMNLTSIYTYLETRFGIASYKTGATFFLISRILGASFRLFLVANVLQVIIFDKLNIPFFATVAIIIILIWLVTYKGGIKTIIWTDTFQTVFILLSIFFTTYFIAKNMNFSLPEMFNNVFDSNYSKIFNFDNYLDKNYFIKQILGGAFITITMTGLDQDMMQKNLSCRNITEAKKNMFWFSVVLVPINLMFLILGATLFIFAANNNIPIPANTDELYPLIVTGGYLPQSVTIFFILGLIAATYASADSALTSLTTSFSIDILNVNKIIDELKKKKIIRKVHILISFILFAVIILFKLFVSENIISTLLMVAGYTYGPLLGLYAFGIFTKHQIKDKFVTIIAILSPIITFLLDYYSTTLFAGYKFGFELIIINGLIMFLGLLAIKKNKTL